jgi:hypothetical protein
MGSSANPFFPGLVGTVDPLVQEALNNLAQAVYQNLAPRVTKLEGTGTTKAASATTTTSTNAVTVLQGTHTTRTTTAAPGNYTLGTLFWETDRSYLYIIGTSGGKNAWFFLAGLSFGVLSSRWNDLGQTDVGALYYATDTFNWSEWSGTAWADLYKIINATSGFRIGNAAASGHYLRGNGATYVDGTIQNGDFPAVGAIVRTVPLAKLTGGGANGSISFDAEGRFVSAVDPT